MSGATIRSLLLLVLALAGAGCSRDLIKDDMHPTSPGTPHCSGSRWVDDSSVAISPIPIVAFFLPHVDRRTIDADYYLKHCGDINRLVNRKVSVSYRACVPAAVTRILTLGVWQWCPAHVSWDADELH